MVGFMDPHAAHMLDDSVLEERVACLTDRTEYLYETFTALWCRDHREIKVQEYLSSSGMLSLQEQRRTICMKKQ